MGAGRTNIGGGSSLKFSGEVTLNALETLPAKVLVELSTGSSTTNGRARKARHYLESQRTTEIDASIPNGGPFTAKLDTNKIITAYRNGSDSNPRVVVTTINPKTGDVTKGTALVVEAIGCSVTGITVLSPTLALISYEASNAVRLRLISITGNTASLVGSVFTHGTNPDKSNIFKIATDKVLLLYRQSSLSYAVVLTITGGTTLAAGTTQNFGTGQFLFGRLFTLSNGKFAVIYNDYVTTPFYRLNIFNISISGTVITFSTIYNIFSSATYVAVDGCQLKPDETFVGMSEAAGVLKMKHVSRNLDVYTVGAEVAVTGYVYQAAELINMDESSVALTSWGNSPIPITVFSPTEMVMGVTNVGGSVMGGNSSIMLDAVTLLSVYFVTGNPLMSLLFKKNRRVIGITKAAVTAGSDVVCSIL